MYKTATGESEYNCSLEQQPVRQLYESFHSTSRGHEITRAIEQYTYKQTLSHH